MTAKPVANSIHTHLQAASLSPPPPPPPFDPLPTLPSLDPNFSLFSLSSFAHGATGVSLAALESNAPKVSRLFTRQLQRPLLAPPLASVALFSHIAPASSLALQFSLATISIQVTSYQKFKHISPPAIEFEFACAVNCKCAEPAAACKAERLQLTPCCAKLKHAHIAIDQRK